MTYKLFRLSQCVYYLWEALPVVLIKHKISKFQELQKHLWEEEKVHSLYKIDIEMTWEA